MEGQFHSLIDIFKTGKEQYPEKTAIIMGEDTRSERYDKDRSDHRIFRCREDNFYKKVCFLSDETGKEDRNTGK